MSHACREAPMPKRKRPHKTAKALMARCTSELGPFGTGIPMKKPEWQFIGIDPNVVVMLSAALLVLNFHHPVGR